MNWTSQALAARIAGSRYGRARVQADRTQVELAQTAWFPAGNGVPARAAEATKPANTYAFERGAANTTPAGAMALFGDLGAVGHAAPSPRPRVVSLM